MQRQYKVGVVSGKFRLLHKAHKEVIVRATLENIDDLVIIIHDLADTNRYSSIEELRIAIGDILKSLEIKYKIFICNEKFDTIECWERFVIEKIGHDDILMFNSKENYQNILLDNKFISCKNLNSISASNIEMNPYDINYYEQIAKEFMPYINKKIVISGVELSGKTMFSIKLANIFNTVYSPEYARTYALKHLGGDDEAFTPKDFVFIAQHQLHQDRKINKDAKRALIIDTDPFVTLSFLLDYYENSLKRDLEIKEYKNEFEDAKRMLETICKTYKSDLRFLLKPNNECKVNNESNGEEKFNKLKKIYDSFGQDYIVVEGDTYQQKFNFIENKVQEIMDIY